KWSVNTGDTVTAGQVIGVEDQGNITSPISGTIVQATPVAEGQPVAPGQPLATVVNMTHLTIVANVEETNYQDVKIGSSVDIFIDATPGTKYSGTVQSIGIATAGMQSLLPTSNANGSFTRTVQRVPVTIAFSSDTTGLKPGMNATVRIHR
ncbi:MAG: secretion protein HlyD family protein, partial [Bacilli bacterium]|nr:secretion protein HlyD family protein [Bacilli bacterium]